jgi:HEAT repeat protein
MTPKNAGDQDSASPTQLLDAMVAALVGPDEARRRAAVAGVTALALPPARRLLIDRLVALVTGRGQGEVRRRAAAALVGLGEAAVPALGLRLLRARRQRPQLALIGVLTEIGLALPPEGRVRIQTDLDLLLARAATPAVVEAVGAALVKFHPTGGLDGVRPEDLRALLGAFAGRAPGPGPRRRGRQRQPADPSRSSEHSS